MERRGELELYTFEEVKDELVGKIGTPERNQLEREAEEAVWAYFIGKAIKKVREERNLTQAELSEKVGIKSSKMSRIERGKVAVTITILSRIFKTLGITSLDLEGRRRIELS